MRFCTAHLRGLQAMSQGEGLVKPAMRCMTVFCLSCLSAVYKGSLHIAQRGSRACASVLGKAEWMTLR